MFGHQVSLNFDKNGDHHFTLLGGLMSILIKLFVFVYVCIKIQILIDKGSNTLTSEEFNLESEPPLR